MTRRRSAVVAALVLVSVVVVGMALAITVAAQTGNDEFEPNDDFGEAASIDEGELSATIVDGESDFYRIEGNSTDAIDVEVDPASGPIELRVYDSERDPLAEEQNAGCCPEPRRIVRKLPDDGTYYVEVAGRTDDTTTDYTLTYDKVTPAENDQFAPNGEFTSASALPEGFNDAKIWGGESDFYRVEGDDTDAIDVEVDPTNGPIELRVYDADRDLLAEEQNAGCCPEPKRIVRKLPDDGTYYVEVAGRTDGTTTEYTLEYDKITPPENDQFAPNGEFTSASTLPEGFNDAKIWGGESDFYRVEGNDTDAIDVEVDPVNGPIELRVYDSERDLLAEQANAGCCPEPRRIVRKLPEDGTYYVEVAGRTDGATTEYTVEYDKVTPAENDQFAPNDGFATAVPIDRQFNGAKIWGGESDFYRVALEAGDGLDVEVDPASGPIELRVYDPERDLLAEESNAGCCPEPRRIVQQASATGTYYVEVAGRTEGATTEYQLQSNRTGAPSDPGPPPVVGDAPPRDPDGDGRYEDVNGDGSVTPGDATVLFGAVFDRNSAVVNNPDAFDFNDDGQVTPGDATVLFGISFG